MLTVTFLILISAALVIGEQFALAIERAGLTMKEAAFLMRVSLPRLYAFKRGESPMDIRRFESLPVTFHDEWNRLRVESRGGVVLTDARLAKLAECVEEFAMAKVELLATAIPRRYTVDVPLRQKESA